MAQRNKSAAVVIGGVTLASMADNVKRIDAIQGKREAYQQEVHDVAMQALATYANSGDNTLVLRLLGGISEKRIPGSTEYRQTAAHPGVLGVDRGWLMDWFARFSDLRFNGKKSGDKKIPDGAIYIMAPGAKTTIALREELGTIEGGDGISRIVDLKGAAKNPWWTLEKAKANGQRNAIDLLNLFSITASLSKRLETARQRQEEGEAGAIVEAQDAQMEAYAKAMLAAHEAWIAANKIDVADLEAERVKRKLLAGQGDSDTHRAVTTGADIVDSSTAAGTVDREAA